MSFRGVGGTDMGAGKSAGREKLRSPRPCGQYLPGDREMEQHVMATPRERAAACLGIGTDAIEDDLAGFIDETHDTLLRARAGSGKTTALIIKIAHLVLDRGVPPEQILAVTFNNAAARQLEARLLAAGLGDRVRVRTFHALAQRIVRAHFGPARRAVFDQTGEDGVRVREIVEEAIDQVATESFFHFCASRMRMPYRKRREYIESVGRDALLSATNFLRARGYGLQNRYEQAWEDGGPIAGNAMKAARAIDLGLKEAGLIDGSAVLGAAAWTLERELERGAARASEAHDTQFVLIDEFQDCSAPYLRLISAIRDINSGATTIIGVGDDWQAINGFAGADLAFFDEPERLMMSPVRHDLLRNRRSGAEIVAWGNRVMGEMGCLDGPAVAAPERGAGCIAQMHLGAGRDIAYTAERLATRVSDEADSLALIARRWKVGDLSLRALASRVEARVKERGWAGSVRGITAHGAKGLEFDQVLLLDDGSFPLEHPARPIMAGLIPEEDYLREEACLRHVAGTRARDRLDEITIG